MSEAELLLSRPLISGMRITLVAIDGVTDSGVLRTPLNFQVGPLGDWSIEDGAEHRDYSTIGAGEFSQPGSGRNLRRTSIDTLTMDWDAPWFTDQGVDPQDIHDELEAISHSRTAVHLYVTSDRIELAMKVTLRNVVKTHRARERDTIYTTMQIVEWRDVEIQRHTSNRSRTGIRLPATHKLNSTDTLRSLSKQFYGDYKGWRKIAEVNGIKGWGASEALVRSKRFKVGSKIRIPQQTG